MQIERMHFKRNQILIDNQVNANQWCRRPSIYSGLTGFLDPLFRVYTSEDTQANILSLSEVEDKFIVTYVPKESFIIHLHEMDIVFHCKDGIYVADWDQYWQAYATSSTQVYTKVDETRARQAYELLRTSGFPSVGEAIHLLQDGNIKGLPTLTTEDLRRACDMAVWYAPCICTRQDDEEESRACSH